MTRVPTPAASLATVLLLLAGSLGAPGSGSTTALHDALAAHDGFVALVPGDDALHAVFSGPAPDADLFDALVPAGLSLEMHADRAPQRMRLAVPSYTDLSDLSERQRDGVPPLPEDAVGIGPGTPILTTIPGEGTFICTANYVFEDSGRVYLGSAGHCFLREGATATHGSGADYDASGVVVTACVDRCFFGGFTTGLLGQFVRLGQVAYARQTGSGGDIGNDFGVVEIPASAQQYVRAEMPVWEGPTGTNDNEGFGALVHYGNGIDSGTFVATKGRAGTGLNDGDGRSWQALVSINGGDSGSAINHAAAVAGTDAVTGTAALGVVTHGLITGGVPLGWGTTIGQAVSMATQANLQLDILLEGETLSSGGGSTILTDVHVDSIDAAYSHYGGNGHRVETTVVVRDDAGGTASGVTVDMEVTSPEGDRYTASGSTDTAGSVTLTVQQKGGGHGTWTSCVVSLSGAGYQHDPGADRETCQSLSVS